MQDIITLHKQMGQKLRHLAAISERGREGIVVFDLNRVIQFVNSAWVAMHGYERPDELVGKQISTFHTQEQMASDVIAFIEKAEQMGQFTGRLGHIRKDGKPFFTDTLMVVFNDDEGKGIGFIGFCVDVTEQEQKEDELRQYRFRMDELVRQRTAELEATNSRLQSQAAEQEQAGQKLKQEMAEMSAVNEQLREQVSEQEKAKEEFQQQRDKLEESMRQQSDELTTTRAQLQDEISNRKEQEEVTRKRTEELEAANSSLHSQAAEHEQAGQKLRQEMTEMSAANEHLREQISEQKKAKAEFQQQLDKLEESLRRQNDELTTTMAQLKNEITKRQKAEEYFKEQADAIKAAGERLRTQIDELSARGPVGEPDFLKAEDSAEGSGLITDDEQAVLENVFRQNIVLQKPKLDSAVIEDS